MAYIYLVSAVLFNSLANLLLKMQSQKGLHFSGINLSLLTSNYLFLSSLAAFGINLILYFFALRHISLSVAYPIMIASSFIIINGSAHLFFHESIQAWQLLGYFLIILGLVLVLIFSPRAS